MGGLGSVLAPAVRSPHGPDGPPGATASRRMPGAWGFPSPVMDDDPTRLLLAAATGDRVALSRFVRATQADGWRFCAALVDPAAADDLTQEVYLRALRAMPRFQARSSARTWLLAIARRVAADEIRHRQRRRQLPHPEIADSPDPAGQVALHGLIRHLDEDQRSAFVLTQVLGLSYADAAVSCEVPVGTIRSRVARARERLVTAVTDDAPSADDQPRDQTGA